MAHHLALRILVAGATLGSATRAGAFPAELPQTTAVQQFSQSHGFAQSSLPTLSRIAPASSAAVRADLLSRVCGSGCKAATTFNAGVFHTVAATWSLDVVADGSSARFENLSIRGQEQALAREPTHEWSATALDGAGRAVLASMLRRVISLGAHEQLVAVRTDYLTAGFENVKTHTVRHYVLANRIVFGRRLNGIPIVGGGSTVTLTFANNGTLQSFRYDWPRYQPAARQAIIGVGAIKQRIHRVITARSSAASAPASAPQISTTRPVIPVLGSKTVVTLQKLECGYFDPGAAARLLTGLVQPGCVYHVVERDIDGMRQGFAGAVPAGVTFIPDRAWVESEILSKRP
jgi:hypothetical protein